MFLSLSIPKLLLLAGVDRLDKDLMVGQMQGKFQMQILPLCGHAVHEGSFIFITCLIKSRIEQNTNFLHKTGLFGKYFNKKIIFIFC